MIVGILVSNSTEIQISMDFDMSMQTDNHSEYPLL